MNAGQNEKELLEELQEMGLSDTFYVGNLGVTFEGQTITHIVVFEDWKTNEPILTLSNGNPEYKHSEFYQRDETNAEMFEKVCGEILDLM